MGDQCLWDACSTVQVSSCSHASDCGVRSGMMLTPEYKLRNCAMFIQKHRFNNIGLHVPESKLSNSDIPTLKHNLHSGRACSPECKLSGSVQLH